MSTLNFAEVHNMIAFLSKPTKSAGFEQIIIFLNAYPIKYALTVNPTIYTSCVEQFYATATVNNINKEAQLHAKVDGKKVVLSEASIRRDLWFGDEKGIDCIPNETIFKQLSLMGAKTTAWNEFSSTIASAGICLATDQKFNFSKYIFDSMVKNLDSATKFLTFPRVGKGFSGRDTPLFPTMVKPRKIKRQDTELPQTSVSIETVTDEAVNEEMYDSLERATTTATSLDAEHDRGNKSKTQSKATPNEPSSHELVQVVVTGTKTGIGHSKNV
nr:hypothetical protein [Tanacetum cinerariifolium]